MSDGEDEGWVAPHPGLVLDGRRELTRLLGSGAFGSVYEARQLDLDRLEAIKFLHERWVTSAGPEHDVRARFLEEARVMARMRGHHLVRVYDFGALPGGPPYFVMERLEGRTLRKRLQEGELTLREAVDLAVQVLEGLCEVHAHGVVHRDVKPENVFLAADGVRLLDFGLAKTSVAMTASDAVMGTPLYMAPELVTGLAGPDARTDLYAAAAVMYEMLAGTPPILRQSMTRRALEHAVVHEQPVPLRRHRGDVPPDLEALVMAGLAKDQGERPTTAREMLVRLLAIRDGWSEAGDADSERTLDDPVDVGRPSSADRTAEVTRPDLVVPAAAGRRALAAWWAVPGGLGGLLAMVALVWLGWPWWSSPESVEGGVLVTRAHWESEATVRSHAALCRALGGDRTVPRDAVVALRVRCTTLPRWGSAAADVERAGEQAQAGVVVHVEEDGVTMHVLPRARTLPLLAHLPVLELPTRAESIEPIAVVLRGVLAPDDASPEPIPALDPELDGLHWTVLAEVLRFHRALDPRDPEARRAHERVAELARCAEQPLQRGSVYCDLARLLHTLGQPCAHAVPPLRGLLGDVRAGDRPRHVVEIELARCLAREGEAGQAEALVAEVLGEHPDEPCVGVAVMSTVAQIVALGGDGGHELRRRVEQDVGQARCPARAMVVRERLARAYVWTTLGSPRWCLAAQDAAAALALEPRSVEAVTMWAEASAQCGETTPAEQRTMLDSLQPQRFDPGPGRVSVAFMRWVLTASRSDAHAVLLAFDEVRDDDVPLLDGTASSLRQAVCPPPGRGCAFDVLGSPKRAGARATLVASLGLGASSW